MTTKTEQEPPDDFGLDFRLLRYDYMHDGHVFNSRVEGEGKFLWIDRDNFLYEGDWWQVDHVSQNGRVGAHRYWLCVDGPRCNKASFPSMVTNLKSRPKEKHITNQYTPIPGWNENKRMRYERAGERREKNRKI